MLDFNVILMVMPTLTLRKALINQQHLNLKRDAFCILDLNMTAEGPLVLAMDVLQPLFLKLRS